ncbi:hypothetical protein O7635_29855 [Asanoa sp. WMMD1127]|uniref:hypothetical protein n=1 Tax=Asanoa sp. WMMD1127 TaxID=3016107 RepID=UPI0024179D12|nr:hypothetical protein [Asanoa sp. WMMD1127]MDG4826074.1 hypothetical protein [Asanoa sp. WMMD1127]
MLVERPSQEDHAPMTAHPRRATVIVADGSRRDDPSTGGMPGSGGLRGSVAA